MMQNSNSALGHRYKQTVQLSEESNIIFFFLPVIRFLSLALFHLRCSDLDSLVLLYTGVTTEPCCHSVLLFEGLALAQVALELTVCPC